MKRGDIHERADVNYAASSGVVKHLYASPVYPLVPINDIVTRLQYGTSSLATAEPIGLPILRMNNLQDDGWDLSDLKYIDLPPNEAEAYRLVSGDLLFTRTNGSQELVGKCAVFREEGHWVFASYLIRVCVDEQKAFPDFLSLFLNTPAGRAQVTRNSRQMLMSNINTEEIRQLQIPLPPLPVQQQLVAEMQAARELRAQRLRDADAELAGIDAFLLNALGLTLPPSDTRTVYAVRLKNVRGGRLDTKYYSPDSSYLDRFSENAVLLGDMIADIHYGASVSNAYVEAGIPMLRIKDITPPTVNVSEVVYLPDNMRDKLGRAFVSTGDYLITRSGSLGMVARVPEQCNGYAFGSFMIRFVIDETKVNINHDYLSAWLNSSIVQVYIRRNKIGAIQGNITIGTIQNIPICLVGRSLQDDIAKEILRRRETARSLREKAAREWEEAKQNFERKLLGVG